MGGSAEHMGTPRRAAPAMWNPQCEEGAGGGAASATWRGGGREGVSVRDIKAASATWRGGGREVPVWRFTRGGSGTWCQYRAQARDEVGGRAGVLHRLRNPQCEGGQGWGKR